MSNASQRCKHCGAREGEAVNCLIDRQFRDHEFAVPRASWDQYFLDVARTASTRATCDRKHVGCVLVRDKSVLATGYNGSVRGTPHCDDDGHMMEDGHCVRTVHAEANAIAQAARQGARVEGATVYVTAFPCWPCFRLLVQAGVVRIVYGEAYRPDPKVTEMAQALGVGLDAIA